jgi:hypothetical protein
MANSSNIITPTQLATAAHRIRMGSIPYIYTYITVAVITNVSTGHCSVYFLAYNNGAEQVPWLTKNTNLCMGPYSDFIDNAEEHGQATCNGATIDLEPMIYNGNRLRMYLGNGDDHGTASHNGMDSIYGGAGNDGLSDLGGSQDIMYGETNGDDLFCSTGSAGYCDGGGAGDYIRDRIGSDDEIYGGGSSDDIDVCGAKEVDCGEGSPGYSDSDVLSYNSHEGTEVDCETVILNPHCI